MRELINRFGDYDAVVVEGTIAGVTAAIRLARGGHRVALVTPGTSPLTELTSCMGAVLSAAEVTEIPDELVDCFPSDERATFGSRFGYRQAAIAEAAEDALLDAGVTRIYDASPGGVVLRSDTPAGSQPVAGVAFGGKFGVAVATARAIIDCTADGIIARSAGAGRSVRLDTTSEFVSLFLHTETEHVAPDWIEIDSDLEIRFLGHLAEVRLARGVRSPGAGPAGADPLGSARRHRELRDRLIGISADWATTHPEIPFTIRRAANEALVVGTSVVSCDSGTGVHLLSVAGDVRNDATSYLDHRTRYLADVEPVVAAVEAQLGRAPAADATEATYVLRTPTGPAERAITVKRRFALSDPAHDDPRCDRIEVEIGDLPVVRDADVIICGLGTSGIEAARSAAACGLKPVCLEKHADVGGVNTVGGVPAYWYGRRTPFFKRRHRAVRERTRSANVPTAFALYEKARDAGAELNVRTPFCGVEATGRRVTAVVCIGDNGFCLARAGYVIDASGDGDIAAWAGAPYTYGSERDEITLWCSFGQFVHGTYEASRQYQSVVDQRSVHDTTRGAIAGRRMIGVNGRGEFIQDYLAPRESRHVTGRTVVTYHDVMAGRVFPDTVLRCKSNVDIKGMASSRAVMCGYVEESFLRNFVMAIPYSALTPVTLSNVLVVGKAYSITHDGISMARMQPDMIQLGTVAGIAIAQALAAATPSLHELDVPRLQSRLFDAELLLPGDLPTGTDDERVPPESDDALADLVDRVVSCPPEPDEWARLFMAGDRAAERLRSAAGDVRWLRPSTAQLLCALGDRSRSNVLLREIDSLTADKLPAVAENRRHDMPDHGWAPRPVYLLCALAECGELAIVERLEHIADLLTLDPAVSDHRWSYVYAFAYAGERLANPALIPAIRRVADDPAIRGSMIARGGDPRLSKEYIRERFAYLELCLARALARCGDPGGYRTLIDYTGEMRLYLARSARAELRTLAGVDHAYDQSAWLRWLEGAESAGLAPIAYTTRHG